MIYDNENNDDGFVGNSWVAPNPRNHGVYMAYDNEICVISTKRSFRISEAALSALGNPSHVRIVDGTGRNHGEFAIFPCASHELGAYKMSGEKDQRLQFRCETYIKTKQIPLGYKFSGKVMNGYVVFSKSNIQKVSGA